MKKTSRVIVSLLIAVLMIVSTTLIPNKKAFADTYSTDGIITQDLQTQLDGLENKYGDISFTQLDPNTTQDLITFDSVSQLDAFIQTMETSSSTEMEYTLSSTSDGGGGTTPIDPPPITTETESLATPITNNNITYNGVSNLSTRLTYSDYYRITWWAPFTGYPLNEFWRWNNVGFNYKYYWSNSRPVFDSYSNISSYTNGATLISWTQTGATAYFTKKYSYNDTIKITVYGYYLLGLRVGGATIGFSRNGKWNCSLTLVP